MKKTPAEVSRTTQKEIEKKKKKKNKEITFC